MMRRFSSILFGSCGLNCWRNRKGWGMDIGNDRYRVPRGGRKKEVTL